MSIPKSVSVSLLALTSIAAHAQATMIAQPATPSSLTATKASAGIAANYANLPLSFEANQGQTDPQVRFFSHGQGYSLFLTDTEAVLALTKKTPAPSATRSANANQSDVVRMRLAGASPAIRVAGAEELPGKVNYFFGKDSTKWHTNVPTYEKVRYSSVYPGVDLVYYGNQRQLEYDFVVAPKADAKPIRLQFTGQGKVKLESNGNLDVVARNGSLSLRKPVIYQMKDGQRHAVDGSFEMLARNTVGFRLGDYDHSRALVIDPVVAYSTYLGGSGAATLSFPQYYGDFIASIAVDDVGDAYVAGGAYSPNFPIAGDPFQKTRITAPGSSGPTDPAFVSKLNAAGDHLLFSTYFQGTDGSGVGIQGIAVDAEHNVYLAGTAVGSDFPTTPGAYQTTIGASSAFGTGFVSKLDPNGSILIFSTLMGGTGVGAQVTGMGIDSGGNTYLTGTVYTPDNEQNYENIPTGFPTTPGAFLPSFTPAELGGSSRQGFVTKMNSTGTGLVYSTFLGASIVGEEGTMPSSISVDSAGNAYIGGLTYDFADTGAQSYPLTAGSYTHTSPVADGFPPGIATKLNSTGSALVYSTYVPTYKLVADSSGFVYGYENPDEGTFPVTAGAFMTGTLNYVLKLNQAGSALVYGTYTTLGSIYGAVQPPTILAMAPDHAGNLLIAGWAYDDSVPVTPDASQGGYVGFVGSNGRTNNAYLQKISANGESLLYGTYLGGSGDYVRGNYGLGDTASAIAVDGAGNAYIAGNTQSHDFPVTPGTYQSANRSPKASDGFITKIAFIGGTTTTLSSASSSPEGSNVALSALVVPVSGSGAPTGTMTFFVDGKTTAKEPVDGSGAAVFNTTSLSVGTHVLTACYDGYVPVYSASATSPRTIIITPAP